MPSPRVRELIRFVSLGLVLLFILVRARCGAPLQLDTVTPPKSAATSLLPPTPSAIRAQAKARRDACQCPLATLVTFSPNGTPTVSGATRNQRDWIKRHGTDLAKRNRPVRVLLTPDWEDADYIVIWWEGSRRYSYASVFPTSAEMYADEKESATTYAPTTPSAGLMIANMRVYRQSGSLAFYSWETTALRWQKPGVDLLKQVVDWFESNRR